MTTHKPCDCKPVVPVDEATLDLSHELRTPLTAIQGALDLLDTGKLGLLTERGRRMIKIAARNVDRLMRLTAVLEQEPKSISSLLSTEELAQLRLEAELKSALTHHELTLRYQPLVSLASAKVTGFEALLCWQHPTLGLILPEQIVPIANSGLMVEIGTWVLYQACQQMQAWQRQFPGGFDRLSISVNLSSNQLASADRVEKIEQTLQQTGLDAHHLKLEITEAAVMDDAETARDALLHLRDLGVQLYVDGFGTGYSSLNRLYDLPLDALKIDRSFIQQLDSRRGESLVRAIANLAHSLGIDVIAEGVETKEQMLKLQSLGCDHGQGCFFAKLLDKESIAALIGRANWTHGAVV